jgi:hypothetical protein
LRTHVQVVAVLMLLIGALFAIGALVSFGLFGGLAALVGASGDDGAAFGAWAIGIAGTALGSLMVVLAVPVVACGVGLLKMRAWARVLGILIAALALINFPWGTAFGVYALWVFFSERSRPLFGAAGG